MKKSYYLEEAGIRFFFMRIFYNEIFLIIVNSLKFKINYFYHIYSQVVFQTLIF